MSHHLDHLFKKALQDKSCEPPSYLWSQIEQRLDAEKRHHNPWWYRGIAAAALIALGLGIWLLHSPKVTESSFTGLAHVYETTETTSDSLFSDSTADYSQPNHYQPIKETSAKQLIVAQNTPTKEFPLQIRNSEQSEAISHSSPLYTTQSISIRRDFIPLTNKEALRNQEEYQKLLHNSRLSKNKEKKKPQITVSGHVVPAYSSGIYSSSLKNTRGVSYSKDQMNGLMNVGGGVKVSVSANKRLSVQTGLLYTRMGQQTAESVSGFRTTAVSTLPNSHKMITTPLGNIKTSTQATAYRSPQAIVLNSFNHNDETIEQTFGTIEIPLHVRYLLNNNKVSFILSGGISSNFIIQNKVYFKTGNEKEYMGSTEDIRNFNVSTDWGLGIEYPLSSRIKIMVEPGFKYYLQSLSENEEIDFKPYLFTLSTGIGIRF